MARGYPGAFGGVKINNPWLWGTLCLIFFVGLANFRRPLSVRNLDLLMLLSPTASLWFFNHGDVFTAVPLFYPALIWVVARGIYIGVTGRGSPSRAMWPTWILLAATVFLAGFRIGLNVEASNVIDVGYSGVIGAERIVHGQAPWGNFPIEGTLKACGPADAAGETRERIQANGRCESANPQGDTYGPTAYESYIPGYAIFGWSGKWDTLPAAHFTSIAFDLLCLLGLWLVGRRFGGMQLAATLAFAWTAYPFTQYASNSNTNDALLPAFLIWGFWLVSSPVARGAFAALSGWTKFASLLVAPLWLTYPDAPALAPVPAGFAPRRSPRSRSCCSSRARCTSCASSGTARSAGRSGGTRRGRSGTGGSTTPAGSPTCSSSSASSRGCSSPAHSPLPSSRGASRHCSSPR